MPHPTPVRPRSVDRRTAVLAALTLVAFGVAATARVLVDVTTSAAASPARYATVALAPEAWNGFDTANVIAAVGASCAGAGVLLFGAALVSAVRRQRGRRLPLVLAVVTLAMVVGAVVAGVASGEQTDFDAAAHWAILRTALAGLAAASLPALCLAALRARARRTG
ncbi:hypothetical protein NY057_07655 [Curtobacterium flaccumfaciens]|uniref:hypothetical protein n=1 Tax=Curtobacterium TaxID=2034 RepID=UPI0008DD51E2|nr:MULTISPECIES: hypothetical protein [Curtobacterium]MCS5507367.1 hypothetical protein [Curtobacterium flaccumfaciens pv. flaccumfaciens]OII01276.1 hypothetical protein BIU89_04780 [Curtobacterium sp. MCBA15_005]UWD84106.1 hypothetical protein NY057_07655 [Curtobacterium flaccumfaciens]